MNAQDLASRDYFTDHSILRDPYAFFEAIRAKGPVYRHPVKDVIFVTGFNESIEVLNNNRDFSSANCVQGAGAPLPFEVKGPDITAQIAEHHSAFHGGESMITRDDMPHSMSRAILSRLFTPSKLKANEEFMTRYAEELVSNAVKNGGCRLIKEIATPFVTMVIADLLGVPDDDRLHFMEVIEKAPPPGALDEYDFKPEDQPLAVMARYFINYVNDRRANPRDDVLSDLSNAKFPNGETPPAMEIVGLATFLFGAGQDTSAKLLGNSMRFIIETPGLQEQLRQDPSLIDAVIEESLRMEGSSKITSRLAKRDTKIGDYDIPVGSRVLICLAAANRDPRRWENAQDFILNRPRIKEHLAFARGAHVCIGSPLARAEIRVVLRKFLDLTSHIDIDEKFHGPRGNRDLQYEPSFIVRGLEEMHLTLSPA